MLDSGSFFSDSYGRLAAEACDGWSVWVYSHADIVASVVTSLGRSTGTLAGDRYNDSSTGRSYSCECGVSDLPGDPRSG